MAHAEKCLVCNGLGKIPLKLTGDDGEVREIENICHGCYGKGWVEVGDDHSATRPRLADPSKLIPGLWEPPEWPWITYSIPVRYF